MTKHFIYLALALLITAPAHPQDLAERHDDLNMLTVPHFTEQAGAAGIMQSYEGGWEFFVGGGGTSMDCNADGMPDLALAGGVNPAGLYINQGEPGAAFDFARADFGLPQRLVEHVLGTYALDIDADGTDDLVFLRLGENIVLRGLGDCAFARADLDWNIDGGREWTTGFAATWEEGAQFPTLAFGNYVDRTAPARPGARVRTMS